MKTKLEFLIKNKITYARVQPGGSRESKGDGVGMRKNLFID